MFGATPRFRGLPKDPIDDVPMYWHLMDGLPVRQGDTPELVDKKMLEEATAVYYARTALFTLPDDLEKYQDVVDRMANGLAVKYGEHVQVLEGKGWLVWLTWLEVRGHIPQPDRLASTLNHPKMRVDGQPPPAPAAHSQSAFDALTAPSELLG